jgi:subtilisin-like proprotein convertase family protein
MSSRRTLPELFRSWAFKSRKPVRTPFQFPLTVEEIEERLAPATLPAPTVLTPTADVASIALPRVDPNGQNTPVDYINPQVVFDPTNPQHQVLVATSVTSNTSNGTALGVVARATTDGANWSTITLPSPLLTRDPSVAGNAGYTNASSPAVAFGRDGTVYFVYLIHNAAKTSGAVMFAKAPFGSSAGAATPLYQWVNGDPARNPAIAVDNNLQSYTDPSGPVFTDPMANRVAGKQAVYVAWNGDAPTAPGDISNSGNNYNPNPILAAVSGDDGATWSNPTPVSDGAYLPAAATKRGTSPQIAISPGNAGAPGSLVFVWPQQVPGQNYSSIAYSTIRPDGGVASSFVQQAYTVSTTFNGLTGQVPDAIKAVSPATFDTPQSQTFDLAVNASDFADPNFVIRDLSVNLAVVAPFLNQLSIVLTSPGGQSITLLNAHTRGDGSTAPTPLLQPFAPGINSALPGFTPASPPPPAAGLGVMNGAFSQTVFSDYAARRISDPNSQFPFIGAYRPEGGAFTSLPTQSPLLASLFPAGATPADVIGTWHLTITDFRFDGLTLSSNPYTAPEFLQRFGLTFSSVTPGMGTDDTIAGSQAAPIGTDFNANPLTGASGVFPGTSPTAGVPSSVSIAFDNSVGVRSPYGGDLYVAYTGAVLNNANPPQVTDTNIVVARASAAAFITSASEVGNTVFVTAANNFTAGDTVVISGAADPRYNGTFTVQSANATSFTYNNPLFANLPASIGGRAVDTTIANTVGAKFYAPVQVNDDAASDGFTEGNRPQFDPAITVDPVTGTVVATWFDTRLDANKTRAATFIATSISGGATWSDQSFQYDSPPPFLNQPKQAVDVTTGALDPSSPVYTLQPVPTNVPQSSPFGPGIRQAVIAFGGVIFAYWAGNSNAVGSGIFSAVAVTAAGPRVVGGDMGPVLTASFAGGTVYNNTFAADGTRGLDGFTVTFDRPIDPTTVDPSDFTVKYQNPYDSTGAYLTIPVTSVTQVSPAVFLVRFNPQYGVGSYSYSVGPNIRDTLGLGVGNGNLMDQNADAFAGEAAVNNPNLGISDAGDVFAMPAPVKQGLSPSAPYNHGFPFSAPYDSTTLPLIVPGPHMTGSQVAGGGSAGDDDLVLAGPATAVDVTFDRDMVTDPADPNVFKVDNVVRITGPAGAVYDRATFAPATGSAVVPGRPLTGVTVTDGGTGYVIAPTVTITGGGGTGATAVATISGGVITGITLTNPGSGYRSPPTVTITGGGGTGATAVATLPGVALTSIAVATAGAGYTSPPIIDIVGGGGTGATAVATIAGGVVVAITLTNPGSGYTSIPTVVVRHPLTATAISSRTFRIGFPTQVLSGTYTVEVDPLFAGSTPLQGGSPANPRPAKVDTNLNAGLDVLRGGSPSNGVPVNNSYTQAFSGPAAVVQAAVGGVPAVTEFPIAVPDNFTILLSPGHQVAVLLNMSSAGTDSRNVQDLIGELVAPDGTTIRLFTNPGNSLQPPGTVWFSNTILTDTANTPISTGFQPFNNGPYNPQFPLASLQGHQANGPWKLRIINAGTKTPSLTSWSLSLPRFQSGTGLGEVNADRLSVSFRIFNQDPSDALTQKVWTAVGPGSENAGGNSARTTGLAVDPSDPSGNTVFLGGASGGLWKTTNFLTQVGQPTWVPLIDSAPTHGLNMGSIAVFPRNNDPQQSIVFVLTGEGDTGSPGVGVLRSMDGGKTWVVLDSTNNADTPTFGGNISPIAAATRDRAFFGMTGFKIIVDPTAVNDTDHNVIVYLAGSQGVWRSVDTGRHWTQMRAGNATDIVLGAGSAALGNGNLQILYAAFRGEGVYRANPAYIASTMVLLTGLPSGNGSFIDGDDPKQTRIPIAAPATSPTGPKGRVLLATPTLTNNPLKDLQYQGWIYATVVTVGDDLDGLYMSKDFGQNWTKVRIPNYEPAKGTGYGTNDYTRPDHNPFGAQGTGVLPSQGNYDAAMAIDPLNPNVVYIGGMGQLADGPNGGLIRVDTTGVLDALAVVAYDNGAADPTNPIQFTPNTGNVTIKAGTGPLGPGFPYGVNGDNSVNTGLLNLLRDPTDPFDAASPLFFTNVASINNLGTGARWRGFGPAEAGSDIHRIITFIDPATGLTRLIVGDDQGVASAVSDLDGNPVGQLGTGPQNLSLPGTVRNGNLQTIQFYSSTAHPSQLAAEIAGAMFYGEAQDDGFPVAADDILQTGGGGSKMLAWFGGTGDGSWVLTDQTGSGSRYEYQWPCCGGNQNEFFRVNGVGKTLFLLQPNDNPITNAGNWPELGGVKFAVNPVDGNGLLISSSATGRLFRTTNKGQAWFQIAGPDPGPNANVFTQFQDLGGYAPAVAFGSPDPANPSQLNNMIYAGTAAGKVWVTYDGGTSWNDTSSNIGGGSVQQIVPDPTRGSRAVYAVTSGGVWFKADSSNLASAWVNLTGNLFSQSEPIFSEVNAPPQSGVPASLRGITSLAVDWKYAIPIDPANPGLGFFPVLYVGGDGGVYRSVDRGASWQVYPTGTSYTFLDPATGLPSTVALPDGGYLPAVQVTQLTLSQGNIDPATGQPLQNTGGLNMLTAATYGRGTWVIRLGTPETDRSLQDIAQYQVVKQSGPKVIGVTQTSPTTFRVQFDAPVLASTFDNGDITIEDAAGNAYTINSITPLVDTIGPANKPTIPGTPSDFHDLFRVSVSLPAGFTPGFGAVTIGPNITDYAGFGMNQNDDFTNGDTTPDPDNGDAAVDAYHGFVSVSNTVANGNLFINMQTSTVAGEPTKVIVSALDPATGLPMVTYDSNHAIVSAYQGTIHFDTSDPLLAASGLPADYQFQLSDAGTHVFTIVFKKASAPPTQTLLSVTQVGGFPVLSDAEDFITVNPGPTTQFLVSGIPDPIVAGTAASYTVTAADLFGNTTPAYTGTVAISITDANGTLGTTSYTFTGPGPGNDNGVHTFTDDVTFTTAAPAPLPPGSTNQTLTALDDSNPLLSITGSQSVLVVPATPTTLTIDPFGPVTAGAPASFQATLEDSFGNLAWNYAGTVDLSSSDLQATFAPAPTYTFTSGLGAGFDNGVHVFVNGVTLRTAGTQTVTLKDDSISLSGSQSVQVTPADTTNFVVSDFPTSTTAGVPHTITITAKDQFGNTTPAYTGTVHLSSSDTHPQRVLPADFTFAPGNGGVRTFANGATLVTAGVQFIKAEDTTNPLLTGTLSGILVTPAAADHVVIDASPNSIIAGNTTDLTVTVKDRFDNTVTDYARALHFTSSDPLVLPADLPPDYTFTTGPGADNGVHTFTGGARLKAAGVQTVTATDTATPAVSGISNGVTVTHAALSQFVVSAFPTPAVAGAPFGFTLTAADAFGNPVDTYAGTVHFTTSDAHPGVALPSDYTFTTGAGGDNGVHVFTDTSGGTATLLTAGTQTLTATDTVNGTLTGQGSILVAPAAPSVVQVQGFPTTITAGVQGSFTVTLFDPFGNLATNFTGTVHFTSTDTKTPSTVLPADYTFTSGSGPAFDNGTHTFTATLTTAGTQTIFAKDLTDNVTGSQANILVNPDAATHFSVTGFTSPIQAGTSSGFTVTALDQFENVDTNYTGTVTLSSTDTASDVNALAHTFTSGPGADNGVHSFTGTLIKAGSQTIIATGPEPDKITGISTPITVTPAPATHFSVDGFPSPVTAGDQKTFTVTAKDQFENVDSNYAGTVHFTSSDGQAALPNDYTFLATDAGTRPFTATLKTSSFTAGANQSITATDTNNGSVSGTQGNIQVNAAAATSVSVGGYPNAVTAGTVGTVVVTLRDNFGNQATGYRGTMHFTSNDPQAVLPADYSFVAGDNGTHTFTNAVTLKTAGTQNVVATDTVQAALTGAEAPIDVSPASTSQFLLAGFTSPIKAGLSSPFTVTAADQFGNTTPDYAGTVTLGSTDPQAGFAPSTYTFTGAGAGNDNGVHSFTGTLKTAGTQTITATDAGTSLTGTSALISVTPAEAAVAIVSGFPSPVTAGLTNAFTVTMRDAFGNRATGYTGTVHLTSNDPQAVLPADYTFTVGATGDNGVHTFDISPLTNTGGATLKTAGAQSITATDTTNALLTGSQAPIQVTPAAAASLSVTGFPGTVTAGTAGPFTVTLRDAFGNVATGYTGTVHLTSNDPQAALPLDYTFAAADAGAHTFTATLKTAGARTIAATDALHGLSGSQTGVVVSPAATTGFRIDGLPGSVVARTTHPVTVTAVDAFGNTTPAYAGTVAFTSSDAFATLPAATTLTGGVGTVNVTFGTAGGQTVRATDSADAAITGVAGTSVTPPIDQLPRNFAVGSGAGGSPDVFVYDPTGTLLFGATPFGPGFTGGIRTAVGDVTGDGVEDLIAATGPGAVAQVVVIDGATHQQILSIQPFDTFTGGVFVSVGHVTPDATEDFVITPDQGGGPRAQVYQGGTFTKIADFFGIEDPDFRGGARAAIGDMDGDGYGEVVVAAGFGGGPRVSAYDGKALVAGQRVHPFHDFFVFGGAEAQTLRDGVYLTVGDVNGDGHADIIAGAGPAGGPRVLILNGNDLLTRSPDQAGVLANFFAGNIDGRGGIRLAVKNLDGDTNADLVAGEGAGPGVTTYKGSSLAVGGPQSLFAFDPFPDINAGVYVG